MAGRRVSGSILVADQLEGAALALTALGASAVALEDNDTIGDGSGDEGGAVGEASPAAGSVEGDVAQTVAESAHKKSHMSSEPGELEGLGECDKALLGRLARRRRSHYFCGGLIVCWRAQVMGLVDGD